jgi:hypothetical protein
LAGTGLLTVSDLIGFAGKGGMIELTSTEDPPVRFRINTDAARRAGLTISSKLLRSASEVISEPSGRSGGDH